MSNKPVQPREERGHFEPISIELSNGFQIRVLELVCRGEEHISAVGRRFLTEIADDLAAHLEAQKERDLAYDSLRAALAADKGLPDEPWDQSRGVEDG